MQQNGDEESDPILDQDLRASDNPLELVAEVARDVSESTAKLWHIFPLIILEVIGMSILVPFLPKIFSDFFSNDQRLVYWAAGGTLALNSFLTFCFAPTVGRLSDSYGRKPFILLAVLSSHIQYFVLAFNASLWIYFALAAATGAIAVSMALMSSYVADVCPPNERSRAFGQVIGVLGFGALLGIGLGGLLQYEIAKWLPIGLLLVNTTYFLFFVPESLAPKDRIPFDWIGANPLKTLAYLRKTSLIETVAILTFLATIAQNGIQDTILFYLRDTQGFSSSDIALFLVVGMTSTVFSQCVGLPLLERYLHHRSIIIVGLSASATAIALYALAWRRWHFFCIIVLSSLGYLTFTVGAAVVANQVGKSDQGVLQGAFTGVNKFGMGMGPLLFNSLAGATVDSFPLAPFLLGSVVALSALTFAFRIPRGIGTALNPDYASETSKNVD